MSLRGRILALGVGVGAAVLLLFAVPLALLLQRAALDDGRQKATDVAQGVADYLSAGATDPTVLAGYVDRINLRDDAYPVEVLLADGSTVGARVPGFDEDDPDGDGRPGGRGRTDGDGDRDYNGLLPTSEADVRSVTGGDLVVISVSSGADGAVYVGAFAPDSLARHVVAERLLLLGGAGLVLLLGAALAAELVARRLVRHLAAAAETADSLGAGDLDGEGPRRGAERGTPRGRGPEPSGRAHRRAAGRRARDDGRPLAPAAHPAHRRAP